MIFQFLKLYKTNNFNNFRERTELFRFYGQYGVFLLKDTVFINVCLYSYVVLKI
jgi:hypothetical protein